MRDSAEVRQQVESMVAMQTRLATILQSVNLPDEQLIQSQERLNSELRSFLKDLRSDNDALAAKVRDVGESAAAIALASAGAGVPTSVARQFLDR